MFLKGCLLKLIYLIYFIFHFFPCQNKLLFKENLINTHIYFDYKWPCHTFPGMLYISFFLAVSIQEEELPIHESSSPYFFLFFYFRRASLHKFKHSPIERLSSARQKKDCWTPIFHLLFFIHEITDKYLRNKNTNHRILHQIRKLNRDTSLELSQNAETSVRSLTWL